MPTKLGFDAVLYMIGDGPKRCDGCAMWTKEERCVLFKADKVVKADDICGLWVDGKPETFGTECKDLVDPDNVEFGKGKTNCGNCAYGSGDNCGHPALDGFAIDNENGCCNAWDGTVEKYNENHDEKGRFADGGGSGSADKDAKGQKPFRRKLRYREAAEEFVTDIGVGGALERRAVKAPLEMVSADKVVASQEFIDQPRVNYWREKIRAGKKIPPILGYQRRDKKVIYIIDGHHRAEAYLAEGKTKLPMKVGRPPERNADGSIKKFNENHDNLGRFAEGPGGGGGATDQPENVAGARESAKHAPGAHMRYTGKDTKAGIKNGDMVKVRSVWGFATGSTIVMYNVENGDGSKSIVSEGALKSDARGNIEDPPKPTPKEPAAPPMMPKEAPTPKEPARPREGDPGTRKWYGSATSSEECGAMLKERHGTKVRFGKTMPTEHAARICAEVDRLQSIYKAKVRLVAVADTKDLPRSNTSWWAVARSHVGQIRLNPAHWSTPEKIAAMERTLPFGVKVGHHPVGCDGYESIISHEYGHILDARLGRRQGRKAGIIAARFSFASDLSIDSLHKEEMKRISGYARTNNREMFAECFSQLEEKMAGRYTGPLNPGASRVADYLKKWKVKRPIPRVKV